MAQLKDTIVSGNLRVTDTTLTDTLQVTTIKAPTSSGGTTYGPGTSGQVLKSNGSGVYWTSDSNTDEKVKVTANTTTKGYLIASTTSPNGTAVEGIADTGVYLGTTAGSLYATSFYENGTALSSKYYGSTISRTANTVLAAPNGSNGGATFRKLVAADLPDSYLPLSGGTMTGIIKKNAPTSGAYIKARDNALVYANADAKTSSLFCVFGGAKSKTGFWGVGTTPTDDSLFFSWGSDTNYANNTNTTNNFSISSTGAFSGTAAAWTTARTLTLGGQLTGSVSVKGNANMTLNGYLDRAFIYDDNAVPANHTWAEYAWHKFAEVTITDEFEDRVITFLVSRTHGSSAENTGILSAKLRTKENKVYDSAQLKWLVRNSGLNKDDFVMVYTSTSGTSTKAELWCRIPDQYHGLVFTVLKEHRRNLSASSDWTLVDTPKGSSTHGSSSYPTTGITDKIISSDGIITNSTTGTATSANALNLAHSNEINFSKLASTGHVWFGYRWNTQGTETSGGTTITTYKFGNANGGSGSTPGLAGLEAGTSTFKAGTFGDQLIVERTGGANMAGITFKNTNGVLGYIAANTVDGDLYHYGASDTSTMKYVILDSHNYTSYPLPRNIKHIHTASGTEGTTGWVKIARITVTAAYADHPMTFTIAQRQTMQYRIHLVFGNAGSVATTTISQFIIARDNSWTDTNNNPRAYIIKPSDGIFDLYIRKTEGYDHIFVVDFTKADNSEGNNYSVTWTNVHTADSEITGGTEAVKKLYLPTTTKYAGSTSAGGAANSSNVLNSNTRMDYGWDGVNYFNINGTAGNAAKVNDTPTTTWWHIMRFNMYNSSGYYTDLAIPFNTTSLYYKRITAGSVQNGGWVKVLDALNVGYVMSSVIKYDSHARRFTSSKTDTAWNAQAYSNTGYADNVYVSFRAGQTTMYAMIGLDANPSEDANYDKIDYCWYIQNNGALKVYESGTAVTITGHTTYASGDEFRVEYSCGEIRYYHNGTMCRSVTRAVSGKLFFDSSFHNAGNVYDFSYGTSTHSTHTAEIITSTYKSSTSVASLTSSVITLSDAASSFGGWICGPTKNGRIAISSYQGSDDKLYFGYGERGRTTNSYAKAMKWDGPTNTLTADKFVGALQGNAATATKLETARNIALADDFAGSADFDGSGNISISGTFYRCSATSNNTANYPWHRIAYRTGVTGVYSDTDAIFMIRAFYNGGPFGIIKVTMRTNGSGANCQVAARWLVRQNIAANDVYIAQWGKTGQSVYADIFLKGTTYNRAYVHQIAGSRLWTLVNSDEASDTTTSDKKTSTEVYASIAAAGTALHNQAYTQTVAGIDEGHVNSANSAVDATRAEYVDVVAGNEIRFYNNNQFTSNNQFWIGYSWAQGSHYTPSGGSDTSSTTAPNITKFLMGNCSQGGLASVHAKTFILGNGSSPTHTSKTTTITTAATTTDRTITLPDDSGTVALTSKTFNVTRGSSVSTATTGYWAAMCNSTQTGSPVLPTSGKWWHVISMDWTNNDVKNWISQLAIATQDGSGVWWRRNDTGGTTINSYSWNRLAEGNSSGAATHVATEIGDTAGVRPVFYAYLGDNTRVVYNTNFTYNPSGNVLTATTFAGNTFKAGKANTTDGEIIFYRSGSGNSGETTLKATAQSTSGTYLLPACGNGSYTLSIGMTQVGGVGNSLVISNVSGIPTGTLSFKIIFKSDAGLPIYSMIEIPNVGDDIDCGGIIQVGDYTDGQQGSLRIVMKGVVVRVTAGTTTGTKTFTATVTPTTRINSSDVSNINRNVIMWKIYACC